MHIEIAKSRLKDVPVGISDALLVHRDALPAGAGRQQNRVIGRHNGSHYCLVCWRPL